MEQRSIYYTTHYNWEWVVDCAASELLREGVVTDTKKCKSIRELPSQRHLSRPRGSYALFRAETTNECGTLVSSVWAASQSMGFLDAKDALWRCLKNRGSESCMPETFLLPWNLQHESELMRILGLTENSTNNFDFSKYLLKAALGSGGNGLYFVGSAHDIVEVVKGHASRAQKFDGFIENLKKQYDEVPSWSLQRLISPVRVSDGNRKTQVRVYAVYVDNEMYIYQTFEVRLPCWAQSDQNPSAMNESNNTTQQQQQQQQGESHGPGPQWTNAVENELVGNGNARPYNESRKKTETERFTLEEVHELQGSYDSIEKTVQLALSSLENVVESIEICENRRQVCIAGIDLVVEMRKETNVSDINSNNSNSSQNDFHAYIVELNNNPAMAGDAKKMSHNYRKHIIEFVKSVMNISNDKKRFTRVF